MKKRSSFSMTCIRMQVLALIISLLVACHVFFCCLNEHMCVGITYIEYEPNVTFSLNITWPLTLLALAIACWGTPCIKTKTKQSKTKTKTKKTEIQHFWFQISTIWVKFPNTYNSEHCTLLQIGNTARTKDETNHQHDA